MADQHREPPHNLEAEQGLLGAMMANNKTVDTVAGIVRSEMFADPLHGDIYAAIVASVDAGQTANPVTIGQKFKGDEREDGKVPQYLARLYAHVVTVFNAAEYARVIRDLWVRREAIFAAEDVVNRLFAEHAAEGLGDITADEIVGDLQYSLDEIVGAVAAKGDLEHIATGTAEALAHVDRAIALGKPAGVSTGMNDLDRLLLMMPSDLVVIGARPGMGKTAMGLRITRNVAKQVHLYAERDDGPKGTVAYFSLEMSAEQLAMRLIAAEAGNITVGAMRRGWQISQVERAIMASAKALIDQWPIHIDDAPATEVREIVRRARKLKRRRGLALMVVDYLQLVSPGNNRRRRNANRVEDVSEITAGLKAAAKELDVPIIALSQLSRALEQREDKRPILSDLRESGSIEQDADTVAFLYRHWEYLRREEPKRREKETPEDFMARHADWQTRVNNAEHELDVIIAKSRHDMTGTVKLAADFASGRINDPA